ncbi:MAG TPA: VWA domain-containing protein [Firmicutes bacterium]|nr:VWA domain-containing protein [Bacillota bacterium]
MAGPAAAGAAAVLPAVCLALAGRDLMSGLPLLPLVVLCLLFAAFLAADILGHRLMHIARGAGHWCLLAVVAAGMLCAGTGAVLSLTGGGSRRLNLDFAYRYLLDGHGEAAREKASLCPQEDGAVITLLADAIEGEYLSAYFEADRLLEQGGLDAVTADRIREVRALSAGVLGLSIDPETGEPAGGAADLPLAGEAEAAPAAMTEEERRERMAQLVREICDHRGAAEAMEEKNEELYRLDKAMTLNDLSELDAETVEELLALYPDDEDVLLVAIKYYTRQDRYEQARPLAQRLVGLNGSESNLVVYTDLIAQQVKNGQSSGDPSLDDEAQKLLKQAEEKEAQADGLNTELPSQQEQYDQLMNEAEDLRRQASQLDITRAVNYLLAKKPLSGDKSGLLDLQIAKLYLATDERDRAKEYIWKVVDNAGTLRQDSPILEPLQEVVGAYNTMETGESDPALTAAVQRLVRAQSQDVVSSSGETVNGTMADFVVSTLKYDRLTVLIGKIDTERYPVVRAYVNVSGEKDKIFGAAEGFGKADFELYDTQYQIKDFALIRDEEAAQVSIALVLDQSGSMEGSPLRNAMLAAEACAENLDRETQRMAVIPYADSASVAVPLTDSSATLVSGIRGLRAGGGTNISGALRTALDELDGAGGTRAIILLTDGQDNNSEEEMQKVLQLAKQQGVAVYAVGLGDVNGSYLRGIAQSTGGKYMAAESSTELADIYRVLQQYIVNNYCFEYTITDNPDTDPRSLTVGIPAYAADDVKAYRISGEDVPDEEQDTAIYPVSDGDLAVYALTPGSAAQADISGGMTVTVRGSGFQKGMAVSVGNVALTNVKVKNAGELTGKLRGDLPAGVYTVKASLPDGRTVALYKGFRVFRAGTVSTVQMGNLFIMADNIGVTSESGSRTQLTATGNVSVNGFLYSTSELTITPGSQLADDDLSKAGQKAVYLGTNGSVEGDGKLYASYSQAVRTAEGGNSLQNMVGRTFAENIFQGQDLVVRNGPFSMDVGESDTDFGAGGAGQALSDELRDYSFEFPGFTEVSAAKVTLYADRLQLDAEMLDFGAIEDNLVTALTGGVTGSKKDREALVKTLGGKWDRFFPLSGSLSVALGASDVRFGGEVSLTLPDNKKFFLFPVKELGLKINSLDPDYEYWSFDVSILMPGIQVIKGNKQSDSTLDVAVGSYFWYPDSLEVAASLDPGIPIFKVFNLTKAGGGMAGASGLFISDDTVAKKDVTLKVLAEADINVFKMLGWKETGAARSITRWGELGKIADAQVLLNFSDLSLDLSADLELLQQKIASAEIGISTKKFLVKAGVGAELSCAGIDVGGDLEAEVSVCWAGQNQDGVSALIGLGGKGHLRCSWANVNWDNQRIGIEFTADVGTSSGTTIAVKVYCNDDWARAWYDSEGLMLWDKFHYEDTF